MDKSETVRLTPANQHEEGGALVDRTFGYTTGTRNVCARVTSFSRFVVAASLAPTAADVTISGRVSDSNGRAISRSQVRFNDMQGNLRTAVTNQFGCFTFEEVEAGQTYVFQATAKGSNFAPQVISVNDDVTELSFVAQ